MHDPRVLIVDDEPDFVEMLLKRLRRRGGLEVTGANDALAALEHLKAHEMDVVVLDVKMPGMDGMEALRRFKLEFPLMEVIMLTGHATVENAIDGMRQGAFDYLMKPCDLDTLLEKVRAAATRKRNHEERIQEAHANEIGARRGE